MIDVKTIYESDFFGEFFVSDYDPMINAFGNVVIQVSDNDYQGDTRVLYNNNGKIGHLIFGWGSCSGCDALQACENYDDLQELCNELENDIKWFDDAKEALEWFKSHDWQGDFIWHVKNGKKYVKKAISYLSELAGDGMTLKETIKSLGISQRAAAEIIGMPLRTLEAWLGGKRTPPEWVERLVIEKLISTKEKGG